MKNKKIKMIFFLSFVCIIFISFILSSYIKKEKEEYELNDDFTRASEVMIISFNKSLFYGIIRLSESVSTTKKDTIDSLIINLKEYEFIPILNYLSKSTNNEKITNAFLNYLKFLEYYNSSTMESREDIFMHNSYYTYENGIYTYQTKKKVIKKEFYDKKYKEYLKSIKVSNSKKEFINELYSNKYIKKLYSYNDLKYEIENNYDEFYLMNKDYIEDTIGNLFNDFINYILKTTIVKEEGYLPYLIVNENDIETEEIIIDYKFKRLQRIYESIKYYKSVIFSDNGMYVGNNNKFNFLKVLQLNMINKYQVYQIFKYENSGSFVLVHSSKDINYNDLENKCSSNNNAGESMPKKTVNMLNKTKKIVIKDNNHNILNTIEMVLKYALNNGYISPKNLENL